VSEEAEKEIIESCLLEIESRLGWGGSADWTHYDFEKLSEILEKGTGIQLSVTTLKRLWGKIKYDHAPSLTTLNTLASFLGYEDWRGFKLSLKDSTPGVATELLEEVILSAPLEKPLRENRTVRQGKSVFFLFSFGIIALIGLFALNLKKAHSSSPYSIDPARFSFEADKIKTSGLPNSVIFRYDASASPSDSVFISQTWDIRRKTPVDKYKKNHSAIYYYPGYFKAKLMVDTTVVKTHDIQITTDGWLGLVETDEGTPIYYQEADLLKAGWVGLEASALEARQLPLLPVSPKVRIYNQRDFEGLMNDRFVFETQVMNPFRDGDNACQRVQVLIHCKDDIISIPLSAKACVGDLQLSFAGARVHSKSADLSGFGADLNQWTHLKVVSLNKKATLWVNGVEAYSLEFPNEPTEIVGVQYRFNGPGLIRDTWFLQDGRKIEL